MEITKTPARNYIIAIGAALNAAGYDVAGPKIERS